MYRNTAELYDVVYAWKDYAAESEVVHQVARATLATRIADRTTLEMRHLVVRPDSVDYLVDRHELTLFGADQYLGAFGNAGLRPEVVASPSPDRDRYVSVKR